MNVGSVNWNWQEVEALRESLASSDDEFIVSGGQAPSIMDASLEVDEGTPVPIRDDLREGEFGPGTCPFHEDDCGENGPKSPKSLMQMVEAGGVEPPSLAGLPAATTCLVGGEYSVAR